MLYAYIWLYIYEAGHFPLFVKTSNASSQANLKDSQFNQQIQRTPLGFLHPHKVSF